MANSEEEITLKVSKYFNDKRFSDLVIKFDKGNQSLHTHTIILCGQSTYFKNLCERGFKEGEQAEIELHDDNPDAVRALFQHLYGIDYKTYFRAEKDFMMHVHVFAVADKYDIADLRDITVKAFVEAAEKDWTTDLDAFLAAVETVFSNFPADRAMQASTLSFIEPRLEEFMKLPAFDHMLEEVPALTAGLLRLKSKDKGQRVKCSYCTKAYPRDISTSSGYGRCPNCGNYYQ